MAQVQGLDIVPYCGPLPAPGIWWASWNTDPLLLAALAVALCGGWYGAGDRGAFLAAWGLAVVAFVSPLCGLTTVSLGARSLHHLVVFGAIAPLLAWSLPWRAIALAPAAVATAAVMAAWHVPQVYAGAWASPLVYWMMQLALLGSAWALWSNILHGRAGGPQGLAMQALAVMGLAGVMGLIGAILTFAPVVLFDQHLAGAMAWGFAPLADQQMAGLIMWVPGMGPLALIAGLMLRRLWRAGQAA